MRESNGHGVELTRSDDGLVTAECHCGWGVKWNDQSSDWGRRAVHEHMATDRPAGG